MREKVIRLRLPYDMYIKFKIFCTEKDLSMPKQNIQLIENFIKMRESEKKLLEQSKERSKK